LLRAHASGMTARMRYKSMPCVLLALLLAGCGSREANTPPPVSSDAPKKSNSAPPPAPRSGPGAYKWDGQTANLTFNAPLGKVASAAQSSLKKTGFTEERLAKASGVDFTTVEAATKAGIVAHVELRSLGGRCDAKVRVGEVGDEPASERILDEISQALTAK